MVFDGHHLTGLPPEKISRAGIAYVPQGRALFPSLTVDEHLRMLANGTKGKRWTPDAVYERFPASPSAAKTVEVTCPESNRCWQWAGR